MIFPPTSFSTGAIVDYNSSGAFFWPHRSKSSSRRVAYGTRAPGAVAVRRRRGREPAASGGPFSGPADLHTISGPAVPGGRTNHADADREQLPADTPARLPPAAS